MLIRYNLSTKSKPKTNCYNLCPLLYGIFDGGEGWLVSLYTSPLGAAVFNLPTGQPPATALAALPLHVPPHSASSDPPLRHPLPCSACVGGREQGVWLLRAPPSLARGTAAPPMVAAKGVPKFLFFCLRRELFVD